LNAEEVHTENTEAVRAGFLAGSAQAALWPFVPAQLGSQRIFIFSDFSISVLSVLSVLSVNSV
jgi:hypothetical protein